MAPPRYRPTCNYRACRNGKTGESNTATTYVVVGKDTMFVCGACAHKLALKHGLELEHKAAAVVKKARRKPRPVA